MTVTDRQFLQAMVIVKKYVSQIEARIGPCGADTRTTIQEFIDQKQPSNRLTNILKRLQFNFPDTIIEDIPLNEFKKIRNAGTASIEEFKTLRGF